jgi:hypothetical protein
MHEIGINTRRKRSAGQAENTGGTPSTAHRSGATAARRHCGRGAGPRRAGFKADRAICRVGKRQALGVDILRIVRGNDDVDRAVLGKSFDHREPVFLARNGGESRKKVRYSPMSFSFSDRC